MLAAPSISEVLTLTEFFLLKSVVFYWIDVSIFPFITMRTVDWCTASISSFIFTGVNSFGKKFDFCFCCKVESFFYLFASNLAFNN